MLHPRGANLRQLSPRRGAGVAEGGAIAKHEQDSRAEHHRLDVRDHRRRHTPAARDHGHHQVELRVDHPRMGLFL